jgi:hypothetical protein
MNWLKFIIVVAAIVGFFCVLGALLSFIEHARTAVGMAYAMSALCIAELPLQERIEIEKQQIDRYVRARCEKYLFDAPQTQRAIDAARRAYQAGSSHDVAIQVGWHVADAQHTCNVWDRVAEIWPLPKVTS